MLSESDTRPDAASVESGERTVLLDVAQAARQGELPPSTLIDEYQVLATMGSGGMGTVYRAFHRRLHKVVALKVLHRAEEASLRRFQREMTLQARLSHPNICPVTDSGVSVDGRHYLVMDFIHGAPLSKLFLDGELTPQRAARVLAKVARAIAYAHERGVLHRDLKPDNVLVDEAGEPHVVDFGIAREMSSETPVTAAGVAIGTPYYMAPEQIRCQPDRFGPCTDIWAIGAVLFHIVAARPPFYGATHLDTLRRAVTEPLPALVLPTGGLAPEDLDAICRRCMAKEPQDRYRSAVELADDLESFAHGDPISIRPRGALARVGWALRRHRKLLAASGAIAAAAACALGALVAAGSAGLARVAQQAADGDALGAVSAQRAALIGVAVLGLLFVGGVGLLVVRGVMLRRRP